MIQTKIVATISDQRCDVDFIKSLYNEGMNVARLNTAHISTESAKKIVDNIRAVSEQIAIIIDTKGPEIRTCSTLKETKVTKGDEIIFSFSPIETDKKNIGVSYDGFVDALSIGDKILIDDGDIAVSVKAKHSGYLLCRVENNGTIKKKKSINVPGVSMPLPSLSNRDVEFIHFAIENDIDFIAHSFVRNKADVIGIQEILDRYNSKIKIIAKIENTEGVENSEEILENAYGIMVARGDLGIEIKEESIPGIQRDLVRKAMLYKKVVIIATQMLHSMIEHPRPTRAEVSDVASAIYMGTDAIMLSGETAYGQYPAEAVKVMHNIAKAVEPDRDKRELTVPLKSDIPAYLAQYTIRAARELKPKAIVTTTTTGKTGRYLAAHRSFYPVYVKCHSKRVVRELALSFGIHASFLETKKNKMKIQKAAIKELVNEGTLKPEDMLIYVGGRFGEDSGASFIEISTADKFFWKPQEKKK